MLLALSVISFQAASLGAAAYKIFDQRGGTIGRVAGNDWVLPDPDSFVSSRHANVRWAGGAYYLEDTSSNGTFINAPDRAAPRGTLVPLNDGDRLYIGDFEIMVQLIDAPGHNPGHNAESNHAPAATPPPEPVAPSGLGLGTVDPLAALGAARSEPQPSFAPPGSTPPPSVPPGASPPPAAAPYPPAASFAPAAPPATPPAGPAHWEPTRLDPPAAAPNAPAVPDAAPPPAAVPAGGVDTAAELLRALGLDPARVDPAVRQQLGTIVRIAVQGLVDVLKSRAEVKNSFRLPMTSIKPVENNPLKFSMNADDALYNLFVKRNPGYLGPTEAFEEGFQDVLFHQAAVLAGIRAAFNAMLAKFHPTHLEELYERKLRRTSMLGIGGRGKYWEYYRERFEEIDRDREAHFQLLFGEEFARAYDAHLQKLTADARLRKR